MIFTHVDVSELAPPEPMSVILSALAQALKAGDISEQCVVVKHRRQPFPLYERLLAAGWAYHCQVHSSEEISLYIYRQTAQKTFDYYLTTI